MIVSRDLSEACMCSGKTMWICRFTRQKEHNNMCLAIEKMKEKGRREGRKEEREKSSKALNKALDEERKNGICNLIATCRRFGVSLEMACRQLMECYHLTQSEASAYLKEYYA